MRREPSLRRGVGLKCALEPGKFPRFRLKRLQFETSDPVIWIFGNTSYAAYTLHVMREEADGFHVTTMNETRVFVKQGEDLVHGALASLQTLTQRPRVWVQELG